MSASSFVHLHVHSHYSLLDGATRIQGLIDRAKQFDMPAVAISDHGNMFGAIEFYSAAIKAGIKPIIGCELYLAAGDRRDKQALPGKESFHLLVLAMNLEGYHNLMRLSSIGYTEGFYRKPRIDKEVLREHSAGLICTSTCIGGEVPQAFMNSDRKRAKELAETYLDIFGPERFFIELQDHGMEEQKMLNPELIDLANQLGAPLIATNDVHYLEHEDVEAHDILCCINTGANVDDESRFRFPTDQFFFKSTEEMVALFPKQPEAISNTVRLADMCNLELDLSTRHAPVYRVPDDIIDDAGTKLTDAEYLRRLVYKGAGERYDEITDELRERIDYELEVITSKGFASYFLITWDCVNFARSNGIPVSARGSGCSAVVAYALYISRPDPMRYGLYFERFMDPDRDEMPDIDLDICQNGRSRVIDYVRDKYGHVAQIITFGTLKAKAVVKDVARVMGLGFEEANNLTKLIPADLHMTLDKALKSEPELQKQYKENATTKRILDIGRRLEGIARNAGVHAAGVVVADQPLTEFLPLYKSAGQETLITQYDGPTVERVGLLKMDFLGLRTLTTLEHARQLAEKSSGESIDLEHIPLDDKDVYTIFSKGDTKGVFQFESGGMRDVVMRMKPNRIEDLIAANALYRPGPMEYIPEYIERKHGKSWTTPHPIMTEVLEETYGIMVYQEQVSRLVNRLGGIELKKAFRLAKAISKKKTEMIEAMREPFLDGCEKNGVPRATANQVFEDILKFGGYAFNKAHSTGYAIVAFQTAWMKHYHPVEFMAAVMTFEMSSTDKIGEYREECKQIGINVEPPDINRSTWGFAVEPARVAPASSRCEHGLQARATRSQQAAKSNGRGKTGLRQFERSIRFGLGAIKGVGEKAVHVIEAERDRSGPFESMFEFCERIEQGTVNRATIEAMVCTGCFDSTGAMRKGLFDAIDAAITCGNAVQKDRRSGQMSMFGAPEEDETPAQSKGLDTSAEWDEAEMLAREKQALGFYITKHPLASHSRLLEACATASTVDLSRYEQGTKVILGGMVSSMRMVRTKAGRSAGKPIGIATFEDLRGRTEAIAFSETLEKYRAVFVPDQVLFLEGEVDRKREEPSLRIDRVITRAQAVEQLATLLLLDIDEGTALDDLIETLRAHPGPCPVYIQVPTKDGMIAQIHAPSIAVTPTPPLVSRIHELLGESAVQLLGASKRPIPLN